MDKTVYYINNDDPLAMQNLSCALTRCICATERSWDDLVILCIGSDRITGDCLGPICGQRLSAFTGRSGFVYGTLANPVHALNLSETLTHILAHHPSGLILAIDASLGEKKHLGYISTGKGPLIPGAGVKKELPAVGDIFITGIVNQTGVFDRFLLQTTRLSTVVSLADTITGGIVDSFTALHGNRYLSSRYRRSRNTSFDHFMAGMVKKRQY